MKKHFIFAIMMGATLFSATSCCKGKKSAEASENQLTSGINIENLDTTMSPAQDFYQYACGGWMKNHPLTGEYSRYGTFDKLSEDNREQLKGLIEDIAAKEQDHTKGSIAQKIATLYNLGMDTATIETQGSEPIQADLKRVADVKNKTELTDLLGYLAQTGSSPFFGVFGEADPKNSDNCIAWLYQSGLGIGDRDYYLQANMQNIRDAYAALTTKLFVLSNYAKIAGFEGKEADMAGKVLDFETNMAKIFMDKETARDPFITYNMRSIKDWQSMLPAIDVKKYLTAQNINGLDSLNVCQIDYIKGLNTLLEQTDLEIIKAYIANNITRSAAPYLSKAFVDANFDFYGRTLSGQTEQRPRWKRVVGVVDGCLGEAVGQMYVEKYFPQAAKDRMLKMVENISAALSQRIADNAWMSDTTKQKAQEKLTAITVKIGFPDKWRDYSNLNIERDNYYANIERASRFEVAYQNAKIGKKVDRTEWHMTPQTVNAYYNPTTNEICFPAGILQPPFFDMNADDAANYGAIGVVIGHEITHGFDDQGHNYDKVGNLNNWWTDGDSKRFTERTQMVVDYFNNIEVAPGVHANGKFTLGENIADNGGCNISLTALQMAKQQGTVADLLDGFTPEQRFFLAYANVWAGNVRDEEIIRRTKEDPHSLGRWRVNGTLPHINGFAEAFGIKAGDPMYLAPDKRALIW